MNTTERTVDAEPTKEFFIHMLVRDIALPRAILDLVDNCVDGALRMRDEDTFDGLHVALDISRDRFRISDNCGGIPIDVARKYAFRFGRLPEAGSTKHSIGQFGVGMKRALFKMGRQFTVESTTEESHFVISEDVEDWKARTESWSFTFDTLRTEPTPGAEAGTIVTITALHQNVATAFGSDKFINELRREIEEAHTTAIERRLTFSVNGIPLQFQPIELLDSEALRPAVRESTIEGEGVEPVRVRIYAGVAESNPQDAGWYVFCNGRMVMGADQTETTGWGAGEETLVPKYHNRSARFRGYVFFDCDDAGRLPWNTTKTGVDIDSPVYRAVRQEMITVMRPVIDFLNKLSREVEEKPDETPMQNAVEVSTKVRLLALEPAVAFRAPATVRVVSRPRQDPVISYRRPQEKVFAVMNSLGVHTQKEVGERTFDYYYDLECAN